MRTKMQLRDTLPKGEFPNDSFLERMAEDDAQRKKQFEKIMESLAEIKEGLDKLNVQLIPDHVLNQLKQYATSESSSDSDSTVLSSDTACPKHRPNYYTPSETSSEIEGKEHVDSGPSDTQHAATEIPSNHEDNERVDPSVPEHQDPDPDISVPDDSSEDMFHFETDFAERDPNLNANETVNINARASGTQGPSNTASSFNLNINANHPFFPRVHPRFPTIRASRHTNGSFFNHNQSRDPYYHLSRVNHNISLPTMPSMPSPPILPSPPSSLFDIATRHSSYNHRNNNSSSNNADNAAERAKEIEDLEKHVEALRARETVEHEKYLDMLRRREAKSMVLIQKEITDLVHARIGQAEGQLDSARLRDIMA